MLPRLNLEGGEDGSFELDLRQVSGTEGIGAPFELKLSAFSMDKVLPKKVLNRGATVVWDSPFGARALTGVVTQFARKATADAGVGRHYTLRFEPNLVRLRYVRRCRIFQDKTIPDIIREIVSRVATGNEEVVFDLNEDYSQRRYLVQYQETDLNFLHRLCKESGIYYQFLSKIEDGEFSFQIVFKDCSTAVEVELKPLVVSESESTEAAPCVRGLRVTGTRCPGKVVVRAYAPEQPAHPVEGEARQGGAIAAEENTEIYAPTAWIADGTEGNREAKRILNRRRYRSKLLGFETNQPLLCPGVAFECESSTKGSYLPVEGIFLVSELKHHWVMGDSRYRVSVVATESRQPLVSLARCSRPTIAGLHTATVTGHPGEEIDSDDMGRVYLSFPWDQSGKKDHTSSCPVRVVQPNMPGAMLIPRIGWEVLVAFEEGDPDRPIVVGRAYNSAQTPPYELPAHKNLSVLRTFTTPGGAGMNSQHMSDTAGSEHFSLNASFGAYLNVGNNYNSTIAKKEELNCKKQESLVGVNEKVSVADAYTIRATSQSTRVGAMHKVFVGGSVDAKLDTETVVVGGALVEKIGSPVKGLVRLGLQVLITVATMKVGKVVSARLERFAPGKALFKKVGQKATSLILKTAGGAATGAVAGAATGGGWGGAAKAGLAQVASLLPGGGALLKAAEATAALPQSSDSGAQSSLYPWEEAPAVKGSTAAGGGAGEGAGATGAASRPGLGHRIEKVDKGGYVELIGAQHTIITPGSIAWECTGASSFSVGGAHAVAARDCGVTIGGSSTEKSASYVATIEKDLVRSAKTWTTKVGGDAISSAGAKQYYRAERITLKGAKMELKGAKIVFNTGSALLVLSDSGMIYRGELSVSGQVKQSKAGHHQ